jgi:hypothetical protein
MMNKIIMVKLDDAESVDVITHTYNKISQYVHGRLLGSSVWVYK